MFRANAADFEGTNRLVLFDVPQQKRPIGHVPTEHGPFAVRQKLQRPDVAQNVGQLFDFATGWGFIKADGAINEVLAQLPLKTINSNPASGASEIPIDTNLSWEDGGGAVSYDVYFGIDPTPDELECP